jgi:hypothetical protein
VVVCCDATCGGGGSGPEGCGSSSGHEPLLLSIDDAWTKQYGTDIFEWVPTTTGTATDSAARDSNINDGRYPAHHRVNPAVAAAARAAAMAATVKAGGALEGVDPPGAATPSQAVASTLTGQIKLRKSGKCVGTLGSSHVVELIPCAAASAQATWQMVPSPPTSAPSPGTAAPMANSDAASGAGPAVGALVLNGGGGRVATMQGDRWCLGVSAAGGGGGGDLHAWTLDAPFSVDLDNSSQVTILPYIGQIAFNGNVYSDGGEVQFYAQALGVVAAENRFERTGGLSAWARGYSGKDANLRNSFIDNTVVEGNHAWNYNTLPNPKTDPNMYPYFPGGSKTIEPWWFGSLTNEQGPPIDPTPGTGFTGAFNRFIIFRGNQVASNGGLVVRGTSANVLVENNGVARSHVGIHVNYTTTQGGVVLKGNVLPAGVPTNFNPYAREEL